MKKYLVLLLMLLGNRYLLSNDVTFVNKTSHRIYIQKGIAEKQREEDREDDCYALNSGEVGVDSVPVGCYLWVIRADDERSNTYNRVIHSKCDTVIEEKTHVVIIRKWLGKWFITKK